MTANIMLLHCSCMLEWIEESSPAAPQVSPGSPAPRSAIPRHRRRSHRRGKIVLSPVRPAATGWTVGSGSLRGNKDWQSRVLPALPDRG